MDSEIDAALAQIVPSRVRAPISDGTMRLVIKHLVDRRRKNLSTHEACQEIAIKTKRSYEWVRGEYDSTLISEARHDSIRAKENE